MFSRRKAPATSPLRQQIGERVAARLDADRLAAPSPGGGQELARSGAEIEQAGARHQLRREQFRPERRLARRALEMDPGRAAREGELVVGAVGVGVVIRQLGRRRHRIGADQAAFGAGDRLQRLQASIGLRHGDALRGAAQIAGRGRPRVGVAGERHKVVQEVAGRLHVALSSAGPSLAGFVL